MYFCITVHYAEYNDFKISQIYHVIFILLKMSGVLIQETHLHMINLQSGWVEGRVGGGWPTTVWLEVMGHIVEHWAKPSHMRG